MVQMQPHNDYKKVFGMLRGYHKLDAVTQQLSPANTISVNTSSSPL